jgi:transmembrane sensor
MAVDPNRIDFLLDKFSRSEVNEAEFNELCELLKDDENESDIKRNLIKDIKAASFTELDQAKLDRMLNKVLDKKEVPVRTMFPWKRIVAAAAVIMVVAIGSYFAFFKHNEKPTLAKNSVPVQNDLLPGGNKAVLTLADGTIVTLDSAKNGALVVQGNSQVTKGDGTLAYNEQQQVGIVQNPVYNTVATPKGGQYQLTLADGSKVWLNAASSIHFPTAFTGNERRVEITGEAYFEVAHDAKRPFHVMVLRQAQDDKPLDVQVLGTHFNINAYTDEETIRTTLLEGSVKVSAANKSVTIKSGEQAQMNGGNAIGLMVNRDVNVDQVMAWKNGTFNFDDANLQTIMKQIARWYDVDVEYQGNVPMKTFKGEISRNVPASKVLQMLEYFYLSLQALTYQYKDNY